MHFSGDIVLTMVLVVVIAAVFLACGLVASSTPTIRRLLIAAAGVVAAFAVGGGLIAAAVSGSDHDRQMATAQRQVWDDLQAEFLRPSWVDVESRQVVLLLGYRPCAVVFSIARLYGQDHDGYKLRWRPVIYPMDDGKPVGLNEQDMASVEAACK